MANFKSPSVDDRGQVPCGVHLDKVLYKKIVEWCGARDIGLDRFIRVATYHFFFALSGSDRENISKLVKKYGLNGDHHHSWGGR